MEKYSALMPVYKGETPENFYTSLDSICRQTLPPDEIVIVCDGPLTKELDAVLDEFDSAYPELLHVVRLPENKGRGIAAREGLLACKNEYVARMDSDDISVPNRMEMEMKVMLEHPEISVLGGQIAEFIDNPAQITGCRRVKTAPKDIRKDASRRSPMNQVTVIMRKTDVIAAGNYPPIDQMEDYYLWASMLGAGFSMMNITQTCVLVRTGNRMYSQRGGMSYFHQAVRMERHLRAMGICNPLQSAKNLFLRFCGAVLLPNRVRRMCYNLFLRSKTQDSTVSEVR